VTAPVRVVLVDDSLVFLEAAVEVVDSTPGFELVATGTSGEEAVELAASLRPELVLVDQRMPGMSGLEAADRIRLSAPSTVIAILTADSGSHLTQVDFPVLSKRRFGSAGLAELWRRHGAGP
jgi:DNA-binding NarL/FixJ family response regulator